MYKSYGTDRAGRVDPFSIQFHTPCTMELLTGLLELKIQACFNPIPPGGGGQFDFSYIPKALSLGLKLGFNTNCLSPHGTLPE